MDKYIEFTNLQTGQIETQEVQRCFEYGMSQESIGCELRRGFCLGFQMPHRSTAESNAFWNKIHGPWDETKATPIAYFCDGKSRIPFYIFDGNGYDERYGSSCLFGYVNPNLFSSTECPKPLPGEAPQLGAYIMGFYEGPDRAGVEKI